MLPSHHSVTKIITRDSRLLWPNVLILISPNIAFLQNNGFPGKDIHKLLLHCPMLLLQKNTEWFDKALHRVQNDLHIPRNSTMFIYGLIAIQSLGKPRLEMKLETFRKFGWSDKEVFQLAQKLPLCLSLSEAKLGNALNFFMKELKYGAGYLASRPMLFTCSLEKRVMPRYEILKLLNQKRPTKGSQNFCTVLYMTESKFLKNYVLPFKDEMPEVYELYMKSRR